MKIKAEKLTSVEIEMQKQIRYEEQRRAQALKMLNEHICDINKVDRRQDFRAEARFYLSENQFDYAKAAKAYDDEWKDEI